MRKTNALARSRRHMHRVGEPNQVRCLTFSCFGRLPLFSNDSIKLEFVDSLKAARAQTRVRLIAWVVMPEHVHLLVQPHSHSESITRFLMRLKRPFCQAVIARWRAARSAILDQLRDWDGATRFWLQGGGYDRLLRSGDDVVEKAGYIHSNPARQGLVEDPLEWPWSSARWYAGTCAVWVFRWICGAERAEQAGHGEDAVPRHPTFEFSWLHARTPPAGIWAILSLPLRLWRNWQTR